MVNGEGEKEGKSRNGGNTKRGKGDGLGEVSPWFGLFPFRRS